MLSRRLSISRYLSVCVSAELNTLHRYIYPNTAGLLEGSDRWSEGSSIDHNMFER
ncbi:hypothetical protein HanIR_Chr13g0667241 [Helianthus annuus]|nr:hypothetical protein HanIR_Chr13g0667241 [Helianthus annuus]